MMFDWSTTKIRSQDANFEFDWSKGSLHLMGFVTESWVPTWWLSLCGYPLAIQKSFFWNVYVYHFFFSFFLAPLLILPKIRLTSLEEVHRRHKLDRDALKHELQSLAEENERCKAETPNLAQRFRFYQDLRGYVTDLVECLDEKVCHPLLFLTPCINWNEINNRLAFQLWDTTLKRSSFPSHNVMQPRVPFKMKNGPRKSIKGP